MRKAWLVVGSTHLPMTCSSDEETKITGVKADLKVFIDLSMTWRWWCVRETSPSSPACTIRLINNDSSDRLCSYNMDGLRRGCASRKKERSRRGYSPLTRRGYGEVVLLQQR